MALNTIHTTHKLVSVAPTSARKSWLVYPAASVTSTLGCLKGISSLTCPKQTFSFPAHSSFHSAFYSSGDGTTIHPIPQSRNLVFPWFIFLLYLTSDPSETYTSCTFKLYPKPNPPHHLYHYYSALSYHHLFLQKLPCLHTNSTPTPSPFSTCSQSDLLKT